MRIVVYRKVDLAMGMGIKLQPATLQTYFSFLKTYTGWIGKPGLLKPIHCYFGDPKLYQRFYVAKRDKTWDSAGVDAEKVIDSITQEDRHAGAVARMLVAFGLRFKEGCCLRPHLDVVPAHRANLAEPSASEYLDTHRGTKGGGAALFRSKPMRSVKRPHSPNPSPGMRARA